MKDRKKKINMLSNIANLEFPAREIAAIKPPKLDNLQIYEDIIKNNHKDLYQCTLQKISPNESDSNTLENLYLNFK